MSCYNIKSSAAEFYARYNGIRLRIVEDKG